MNKSSIQWAGNHEHRCVLLPRCVMCDEVPPGGIRDGIRLKKAFICTKCEQNLTHGEVGSIYYHTMLEKIKAILK